MTDNNKNKVEGTITKTLPGTTFMVEIEGGREILAYLSGKMRMNYIKVMAGDKVLLEVSPDATRGRIVYRK